MRPALEEEQAQETVDMAVAPGPERSTLTVAGPSASALGESRGGAPSRRREAAQHPFEFDQVGRSRALRSGWEGGGGRRRAGAPPLWAAGALMSRESLRGAQVDLRRGAG